MSGDPDERQSSSHPPAPCEPSAETPQPPEREHDPLDDIDELLGDDGARWLDLYRC